MKIGGMGDAAVRIEVSELRRLADIPTSVRIVRILPDLHKRDALDAWRPYYVPLFSDIRLFIHVRHRFCPRMTHPGQHLQIYSLEEFIRHMAEQDEVEWNRRGQNTDLPPGWVIDGTPHEEP